MTALDTSCYIIRARRDFTFSSCHRWPANRSATGAGSHESEG
jgi:hypothetical protein